MLIVDPALQQLITANWQLATGNWLLTTGLTLQRKQRFVVHVPLLQDAKDYAGPEPGAHQHAKDARCLLLSNRLDDALTPQELARQLLLVHIAVGRAHHAFDDVAVNA